MNGLRKMQQVSSTDICIFVKMSLVLENESKHLFFPKDKKEFVN